MSLGWATGRIFKYRLAVAAGCFAAEIASAGEVRRVALPTVPAFAPDRCHALGRGTNAWIQEVKKVDPKAKDGISLHSLIKFGDGTVYELMPTCPSCFEKITRIDCSSGLMVISSGDAELAPRAVVNRLVSLAEGAEVPTLEPSFGDSLAYYLDLVDKSDQVALNDCRGFAKERKCRKVWAHSVWIGNNWDFCRPHAAGEEADADGRVMCGGAYFRSAHQFAYFDSMETGANCQIGAAGDVSCVPTTKLDLSKTIR